MSYRRKLLIASAMGLAAASALAAAPAAPASPAAPPAADSALIARGKYLSLAADCQTCHSAPGAKLFSGGAALKTPFGNIYPPNITPDPKTGIGGWTLTDFTKALREGVRKDGASLYPAMPYDSYTKMTDADVAAIWAYMQSVAPVRRTPPANTLPFPFNVRTGMTVWKAAFFTPGRLEPVAGKDAEWNRGAYLVEALGHCSACHTPRNVAQASVGKKHLTGAQIDGWYAPDISDDPLTKVSKTSVDALANYLKTGQTPDKAPVNPNTTVFGPMQEVIHESLSKLTDADLRAMAVYLKDQPGDIRLPAGKPAVPTPERMAVGKALYEENCASCHQADGKGVNGAAPALGGNTAVAAREPYNVVMAMLVGFEPQGTWGAMPSFAPTLTDQQVADVANYVRHSWGNQGERAATSSSVNQLRSTALAQVPAGAQAALACPILPKDQMQPALRQSPAVLKQAARDEVQLSQVVDSYVKARPKASNAQVIQALSTAYCRAIAADSGSKVSAGAGMADFSHQVATLLVTRR